MPADPKDPRETDRLVLTPSRGAQGGALLIWLVLAGSGPLWWAHGGAVMTIAAGMLAAMTVLLMLPGCAQLELTREGLLHHHWFRVRHYAWRDIHALRLGTRVLDDGAEGTRVTLDRVVFNLTPCAGQETDRHDIILDSNYGRSGAELLALLQAWQKQHADRN